MPYLTPSGPEANADGYADLAFAVITATIADLQLPYPCPLRSSAREAARTQSLLPWLQLMALTDDQQLRVLALLDELVH